MTGPKAVMPSATCFGSPKTAASASVGLCFGLRFGFVVVFHKSSGAGFVDEVKVTVGRHLQASNSADLK